MSPCVAYNLFYTDAKLYLKMKSGLTGKLVFALKNSSLMIATGLAMEPSEIFEKCDSFSEAQKIAKQIATDFHVSTKIRMRAGLWEIICPSGVLGYVKLVQSGSCESDDYAPQNQVSNDDLSSDQDDWARSDEEGWFYED